MEIARTQYVNLNTCIHNFDLNNVKHDKLTHLIFIRKSVKDNCTRVKIAAISLLPNNSETILEAFYAELIKFVHDISLYFFFYSSKNTRNVENDTDERYYFTINEQ